MGKYTLFLCLKKSIFSHLRDFNTSRIVGNPFRKERPVAQERLGFSWHSEPSLFILYLVKHIYKEGAPMGNDVKPQEIAEVLPHWEKTKDIVDQLIDIILNYRQSGHPGGSRSKAHILLTTLLSGVMRWDIRHPEKRFSDKFVLGAGHTIPLVYAILAVLNEALRIKFKRTGNKRYFVPNAENRALYWEDLLGFRRRGGLSGHAEMAGKTLFLKYNTGPSGHGSPAAAGIALSLKRAGADGVKVFILEGEA